MSGPDPRSQDREQRLDELTALYLQEGQREDRTQWLAQYPDFADELEGFITAHDRMEHLTAPLRAATGATAGMPLPRAFGDYTLLSEIARGGMGVIYKARQEKPNRIVALKMIRSGQLADDEEIERFHGEAEAVARLDHPGVVPIYEVGQHEGQHFFSMAFVDGQSLAARAAEGPMDPYAAADLIQNVADALQYAHELGVVHRDVKPANVLLDRQGRPRVTDFGLAKRQEFKSDLTATGQILGTPNYMPPEQAGGRIAEIGPASDVYSLGATLYHLVAGRPPFLSADPWETIRQVREVEPVSPRRLNPSIPHDLDTICLKCLVKDPRHRYSTAKDLSDELGRFVAGEPIQARPMGRSRRFWRWLTRHPVAAGAIAAAIALLAACAVATFIVARNLEAKLRSEVVQYNEYAARNVSSSVLQQLASWSRAVTSQAGQEELRQLLTNANAGNAETLAPLQEYLGERAAFYIDPKNGFVHNREESPFTTWFILDAREGPNQGMALARSPHAQEFVGEYFGWRDYFQGVVRSQETLERRLHVSRVYRSRTDQLYKFAISSPVRKSDAPNAEVLGVVVASIATSATFGLPHLQTERCKAALVGRFDAEELARGQSQAEGNPEYVILVHHEYGQTGFRAERIENPRLLAVVQEASSGEELEMPHVDHRVSTDESYVDPISGGRWLAACAPVGNTELAVIVQQKYADAVGVEMQIAQRLGWGVTVAVLLDLVVMAVVLGMSGRGLPSRRG